MHFARSFVLFLCFIIFQPLAADQFETFSEKGKVGLRNTTTNTIVIPAQYETIGWSDGSFSIIRETVGAIQNEKWALIDLKGKHITIHRFDQLVPTNEENFIASIRETNSILTKYGLIDSRGKIRIPFEFSSLTDHPAGLFAGQKNGSRYEQGFLDEKGNVIINLKFKSVRDLSESHLSVTNFNGLEAIYSLTGEVLTDFSYDQINPISDRYYQISQYNHLGILSSDLELVVPPLFKEIEITSDRAKLTPYKQWDYFKKDNYSSTHYYDELSFLEHNFISNAGNKAAVLNQQLETKLFLSNEKLIENRSDIFITQESASKRYKVYDSQGDAIFRFSFDEVKLYDHLIFAKRSETKYHPWAVYSLDGDQLSLSNYQRFKKRADGLFEVQQNNKLGLISEDGSTIGPILFDSISHFTKDRAIAFYGGKQGIVNQKGNWALTPYYDSLAILENHVAYKQGTNKGLTDFYGNVVLRTKQDFDYYGSAISYASDSLELIISFKGDTLLDHQYDSVRAISEELLFLQREERRFLFRPRDAFDIELDLDLQKIEPAKNGYMPVKINDQWGYLNNDGRLAVANRYEEVTSHSEGLFGVKLLGKWGFVNEADQIIIQPNYDEVQPFENDLAVVRQGQNYGLINNQGRVILSLEYSKITRKTDHLLIQKGIELGLASVEGRIIKNPSYSSIEPLLEGYFLVERDGLKGVIDKNGNDILPPVYTEVIQSGSDFLASKEGRLEYFDLK